MRLGRKSKTNKKRPHDERIGMHSGYRDRKGSDIYVGVEAKMLMNYKEGNVKGLDIIFGKVALSRGELLLIDKSGKRYFWNSLGIDPKKDIEVIIKNGK